MSLRGAGYFSTSYGSDLSVVNTRIRRFGLVLLLFIVLAAGFGFDSTDVSYINEALIAVVGALGLHVITGYAGQLSLGHAALLGMSGFVAGFFGAELEWPFLAVLVVAAASGGLIGAILGLPALRLRGLYLVLATVAFHFVAIYVITAYQSYRSGMVALTGLALPSPEIGPLTLDTPRAWLFFLAILVALTTTFVLNLSRTRTGRAWIALRERDLVAASLGVSLLRYKLSSFVVGSTLAGLAGGLLSYYQGAVSAESYTLHMAVLYLVMIIAGGLGSTAGAVIGALFVTLSPLWLADWLEQVGLSSAAQFSVLIPLESILFGAIMLAFLLLEPRGLMGLWRRLRLYMELWPSRTRPLAARRR